MTEYTLYGWHLSYYAGKLRAYLTYKQIPFVDQPVNYWTLVHTIHRKTGARVMPVLKTAQGEWLQDTRHIIDTLELRHPTPTILPATPRKRFASELLETWADEWWMPAAMHTRWNYAENFALFQADAGDALAPWGPRWLKHALVGRIATLLRGYLPGVGIVPAQYPLIEAAATRMLDLLEAHFRVQPYLLGERPTMGDFGLQGPLYGHLGRDPWPKREWIAPRPAVRDWIDRMASLGHEAVSARFAATELSSASPTATLSATPSAQQDHLAPTLEALLVQVIRDFLPMVQAVVEEVNRAYATQPAGQLLPRAMAEVEFPMAGQPFTRRALPFTAWKLQGILDWVRSLPATEQAELRLWLRGLGGERLLDLELPRLRRVALRIGFAEAGPAHLVESTP